MSLQSMNDITGPIQRKAEADLCTSKSLKMIKPWYSEHILRSIRFKVDLVS